jgi:hypothetical protein
MNNLVFNCSSNFSFVVHYGGWQLIWHCYINILIVGVDLYFSAKVSLRGLILVKLCGKLSISLAKFDGFESRLIRHLLQLDISVKQFKPLQNNPTNPQDIWTATLLFLIYDETIKITRSFTGLAALPS